MKTLYACDLDGTLLGDNAQLSINTSKALRILNVKNVAVTFVTARTAATVDPILTHSHPTLPGVVMTGAAFWWPQERQYSSVRYHDRQDVLSIMDICRLHGVHPFIYTLPKGKNSLEVYHNGGRLTETENRFVVDRTLNDLKTFHLNHTLPKGNEDIVVLFFAMGEPESIRKVADDIKRYTDCYASCYPDTYNHNLALLEVFTGGVSKADGLLRLKEIIGADRVVAFGDNLNDIPMLELADVAIAVGNAHADVKEIADEVIGANTTDAVVAYIAKDAGVDLDL